MLVDQKVKKFTELLPCTFAMYYCWQLKDVSSVENVHMVTEIISQVFIKCCHLHPPPLSSVVPQAFGALELKGPLYMTIVCSHVDPSSSNTPMHPTSPVIHPWSQP